MTAAPLRLIVHGVSHTHARWLLNRGTLDSFRVVGLVEPDAALRDRFAHAFGLPPERAVTAFEDLPATDADAVAGFGSISSHTDVVADAAAAGLPVMLEKPLATTMAESDAIADLASKNGISVFTHYETDAYTSLAALSARLDDGDIGTAHRVVAAHGHPGPVERGVNSECLAWLLDPSQDGGAITDFGCYGIAQTIRLLHGRLPQCVTAQGWTRKPAKYPGIEDDATIILDYPGLSAILQPSWCWPFDRKELIVFGESGALHARNADTLERRDVDGRVEAVACPPLPLFRRDPFLRMASVVRGETAIAETDPTHLANATATVRVLEAARRSARDGRSHTL